MGQAQVIHILIAVVPKKRGVVEPAIFGDVLGIATAFALIDAVIVFLDRII